MEQRNSPLKNVICDFSNYKGIDLKECSISDLEEFQRNFQAPFLRTIFDDYTDLTAPLILLGKND